MHSFLYIGLFMIVWLFYAHLSSAYIPGDCTAMNMVEYLSNFNIQTICKLNQPFIFDLRPILHPSIYEDLAADTHGDRCPIVPSAALTIFESYFSPKMTFGQSSQTITHFRSAGTTPTKAHPFSRLFISALNSSTTGFMVRLTSWRNIRAIDASESDGCIYANGGGGGFDLWKDPPFTYTDVVVDPGMVLYVPPYTWWSCKYEESSAPMGLFLYATTMNQISHPWITFPDYTHLPTSSHPTLTTPIIPESTSEVPMSVPMSVPIIPESTTEVPVPVPIN